MSPFGFYSLSGAWLFLLVGPLVLFYFLKLRRPRVRVTSLALWRRVLADKRVNSPFQRFKRNILLLLQLLLLTLIVLAAMQPYLRGRASRVRRVPILVDCSASMAALDKPRGVSRLDEAKRQISDLIDGMLPDQEMCLISFSMRARKRCGFTDNKRALRAALAEIAIEDVPSSLEEALRISQALALTAPFDEVLLFTDGNLPEDVPVELPFDVEYRRLAPAGPNCGITAFNAERDRQGGWDVFVQVDGSHDAPVGVRVLLAQDGEETGDQAVTLIPESGERLVFRIDAAEGTLLQARLVPDAQDSLAADDVAWLRIPRTRPLAVYVDPALAAFRHALEAMTGLAVYTDPPEESGASDVDLAIIDGVSDQTVAAGLTVHVGGVPRQLAQYLAVGDEGTEVVDWDKSSAALRHVELRDVVLIESPAYVGNAREGDLEARGYEVLVYGRRGPLMLRRSASGRSSIHLLFDPERSTWPYRIGFPIFVANLVDMALRGAGIAEVQAERTGVLPAVSMLPDTSYRCHTPAAGVIERTSDAQGWLSGLPALQAGLYRLEGGGEDRSFGVSLLSMTETRLVRVEELRFDEHLSVEAEENVVKAESSLWVRLVLLAFFVLLGEWWFYQRRSGG